MKRRLALILIGSIVASYGLGGCQMTRPVQDNFELDAGNTGIEPFLKVASSSLGASAVRSDLQSFDADPSVMFTITGDGFTIIIQSMGDHRCLAEGNRHTTYRESKYYVDLVYRTSDKPQRDRIRQSLFDSASKVHQSLKKFAECP